MVLGSSAAGLVQGSDADHRVFHVVPSQVVESLQADLQVGTESLVELQRQAVGRVDRLVGLEVAVHSEGRVGLAFLCHREVGIVDRSDLGCSYRMAVEACLRMSGRGL